MRSWCVRSKDWKAMEPGGFLCLSVKCTYEEPRRQMHLLFHFHKHVDPAHPIYLLYHLLILGTHSTQSKVKLRSSCVGRTIAVSHKTARIDLVPFRQSLSPPVVSPSHHHKHPSSRPFVQEVLFHSFTLSPFGGLAVRPLIITTSIYTCCAIAAQQKSKHRSHSTAY